MTDLIGTFEAHLRMIRRTDATISTYIETLRQMERTLKYGVVQATDEELEAWIFNPRYAKNTCKLRRAIARSFFAFLTDPRRPLIDYNPAANLPTIKVPAKRRQPPSLEVVADILTRGGPPYFNWFLLAAYAGARCVEIAAADTRDIGHDVTVLHGKGDKDRRVPTHPLLWQWAQGLPAGPVATDHDGTTRLTRKQICGRGNNRLRYIGHGDVTMHGLRRWFGTAAFEACHDIRAVQELLGHASLSTTQLYVDASRQAMTTAVMGLPEAA